MGLNVNRVYTPGIVPMAVTGWYDSGYGGPRPASFEYPLPVAVVSGGTGGGGGGGGSVTTPGTAGTQAQAVQGVPGGVPFVVSGTVADSYSAPTQGIVLYTFTTGPNNTQNSNTQPALRGFGFICTVGGPITITFADGSILPFNIVASPQPQVLSFAVVSIALGSGTAGTFFNTK
jgi:hypothetical protein